MSETPDMTTIDNRRAVMKIPVTSLCVQAGIGRQTYYDGLERGTMRPDTLAKLNAALSRFHLAYDGEVRELAIHSAYKAAMVIAAFQLQANARAALAADPSRKATADKDWLAAARVRRLAYWIANGMLGFRVTEVARAAGVTKQAVSNAIKDLEDDDDPEIRRVCRQLEEVFS